MVATTTSNTAEVAAAVRFLDELFAAARPPRIAFRLWDGTLWPDEQPRAVTFALKHPGALRTMFESGTEKGLAEAYLREDFELEGDIETALDIGEALDRHGNWLTLLRTYYHLHRLPPPLGRPPNARPLLARHGRKHSLERDRSAVSYHYDVSNDFFRLWLDRRMLYSCAYFERPEADLDEAQEAKLWHLCRKLRLQPGSRLLDIGCGWGGLAIHAAKNFGVRVTGVTLSREQAELATERVHAAGLEESVNIELKDYRELDGAEPFDALVSVGMLEHVGLDQLETYFRRAHGLLKPGGVFLNHAIGEGVRPRGRPGPSFIEDYVFPDSDIPRIPLVAAAAETAGFEVRDVENLREHYALTLRHWLHRLESARDEARRFVDEMTFRIWRLYLAGSAHGFAHGHLAIYQTLLSKPDAQGRSHLPLTRRDWYAGGPAGTSRPE